MLHFRCLLGGLGHHFGSFGGSFWEPKSFILGPWGALGTLKNPIQQKSRKRAQKGGPRYYAYLHLRSHFGSIFQWFLGRFFGTFFGSFLEPFWTNFGSQNGAKIDKKSIQNSIKISVGFWSGSWTVFGQFWERFGEPEPSKMELSCRRGAIFEKITFFRPDSVLDQCFPFSIRVFIK